MNKLFEMYKGSLGIEKNALSSNLLSRAKAAAKIKALDATSVSEAMKRNRQSQLFSDRAHDIVMKKMNKDIDSDLLQSLNKFKDKLPSSFNALKKIIEQK